jgi:hypothetical protein
MTPLRFQFTIRNLLWATFWVAVGLTAWKVYSSSRPWVDSAVIAIAARLIAFTCPFVAVGALFGRARLGFAIGAPTAVIVFVIRMIRTFD